MFRFLGIVFIYNLPCWEPQVELGKLNYLRDATWGFIDTGKYRRIVCVSRCVRLLVSGRSYILQRFQWKWEKPQYCPEAHKAWVLWIWNTAYPYCTYKEHPIPSTIWVWHIVYEVNFFELEKQACMPYLIASLLDIKKDEQFCFASIDCLDCLISFANLWTCLFGRLVFRNSIRQIRNPACFLSCYFRRNPIL